MTCHLPDRIKRKNNLLSNNSWHLDIQQMSLYLLTWTEYQFYQLTYCLLWSRQGLRNTPQVLEVGGSWWQITLIPVNLS